MKIGILSDTHGILPAVVLQLLNGVDHIFHAGDIGDVSIIRELEMLCPVSAIHGNIDPWPIPSLYPNILITEIDGKKIIMKHDIVDIREYSYELFKKRLHPDIVIHGHTHKPDATLYRNIYYINPGSVIKPRVGDLGSVVVLELNSNKIFQPETKFFEIKKADLIGR
jgi:putative phosphoesterase